jgi:putative flippase GtrA
MGVRRRASLAHQPVRFILSGAAVAICHFSVATLLIAGLDVSPQPALVAAYGTAIALHFTLNRQFVFTDPQGYALRLSHQGVRYLVLAGCSYAITAVSVAILPGVVGLSPLVVFYCVAGGQAVLTFLVLRHWVFRPAAVS